MSRIFWDTNLFIYLFESSGVRFEQVLRLRKRMLERGDELFTSALTLGELLVVPTRAGRTDICQQYTTTVREVAQVVPFDVEVAGIFARVRAQGKRIIRPADGIQLACAAAVKTDLLVTNDRGLLGLHVPGIQFITSLDHVPL